MNTLIVLGVVLVLVLVATLIFVRVTRSPGEESPKRRDLKAARLRAVNAQRAMHDIDEILTRHRAFIVGSSDPIASTLADEVSARIRQYKTETLELDK